MTEASIKLKRKQPALLLLSIKPYSFIKITYYIKSTNNDHFPFALKRAKPKTSPNKPASRFHTVFNSLIRQRKSLPSLGTAAIYRTRNKVLPCVCARTSMHVCIRIFYSIVNMDVIKKKSSLQYHFTTFF